MEYQKHFLPLESDPAIFTQLARALGLSTRFEFQDVFALSDQHAIAVILIYHTPEDYDDQIARDREEPRDVSEVRSRHIIWLKQTINNACALYGILHAILNGSEHCLLEANSIAENLRHMSSEDQIYELETSAKIKDNYDLAARSGGSEAPEDPEESVDYHYTTFVTSGGRLIELDGDSRGAIDRGLLTRQDEGALGPTCLDVIDTYRGVEGDFHVLKLVRAS